MTTDLPCSALQARLEDRPLRAVDHDRHAGDVGLGGDEVEELRHHLLGVEQPFVHVDVEDVGAAVDLLPGDGQRRLEIAALISCANFGEPVTLVRSPTMMKFDSGRDGQRFEAAEPQMLLDRRRHARRKARSPSRRSRGCARASCRSSRRRCSASRCRRTRAAASAIIVAASRRTRRARSAGRRSDSS